MPHSYNACVYFNFVQTQSTTQSIGGSDAVQSALSSAHSNTASLQIGLGPLFSLSNPSTTTYSSSSVSTAMTLWNNQQTALSGQSTIECLGDSQYDMTVIPYVDGAFGTLLYELTNVGLKLNPPVNPAQEAAADAQTLQGMANPQCTS